MSKGNLENKKVYFIQSYYDNELRKEIFNIKEIFLNEIFNYGFFNTKEDAEKRLKKLKGE